MITEIECVYEAHFSFKVSDLEVDWNRVTWWSIKYGTLHYVLDDGTEGEEYLYVEEAYDNLDTKWPVRTMVCYNGIWMSEEDYNEKMEEEE
jgi:hypothetical protein